VAISLNRLAEPRELARSGRGRSCIEFATRNARRRSLERTDAPGDRLSEKERRNERGRGRRRADLEQLHVVVHVKHDETADGDGCQRQGNGDERERGELQSHRRQQPQGERGREPGRERAERDDECESGQGLNR